VTRTFHSLTLVALLSCLPSFRFRSFTFSHRVFHNATRILFQLSDRSFGGSKWCASRFVTFSGITAVDLLVKVFEEYEERLRRCDYVPRFSYGRRMMPDDGGPNRYFLMYLLCEHPMAIRFLKDVGLLRSKMQCKTCGRDMTWSAIRNITEGFRWRCQRSVAGIRCNQSVSIKLGSWFQQSNFIVQEILLITYDIVRREPALHIQSEYCLSAHTVADWGMFCRETILVFFWRAALLRLVVLIRLSKLSRASQVRTRYILIILRLQFRVIFILIA